MENKLSGKRVSNLDADLVRQNLEQNFPTLQVDTVEFLDKGMDSRAFQVNGEYVFQVPYIRTACEEIAGGDSTPPKAPTTPRCSSPDVRVQGNPNQ